MVFDRDDVEGLDASILTKPNVLKFSGHETTFSDPMVDCKSCNQRFRADQVPDHCKKEDLTEPRQFNLMFKTAVGPVEDKDSFAYLRPETAQNIFTNFKNVVDSTSRKVPFGIAQIGKAFRNEITPRNFIFRVREFEQMELEFFVVSDEELLKSENIENIDIFCALTNDDETNIMSAFLAKKLGAKKTIIIVNNYTYINIIK